LSKSFLRCKNGDKYLSDTPKTRAGANAISNLVGYVLITLVTIVCTPIYIRYVGNARYGMIALVWLLFSYFNVFDFGISRATTNQLAKSRFGSRAERATFFWTALCSNVTLGSFGAVLFFLISKQVLSFYIKVPDELTAEVDRALPDTGIHAVFPGPEAEEVVMVLFQEGQVAIEIEGGRRDHNPSRASTEA